MNPFRLIMADADMEFCASVADYISSLPDFQLVAVAHDAMAVIMQVDIHQPDILLLDIDLPVEDGLSVLQYLHLKPVPPRPVPPKVVVFSSQVNDDLVARAITFGANYYIMKPMDLPILAQRLRYILQPQVASEQVRQEQRHRQIEHEVIAHLTALGVPPQFKGYNYLRDAVIMAVENSALLNRITKGLYPAIAGRYSTSSFQVERSIRHAIEVTWTRGNLEAIHRLFAYCVDMNRGKPTNSSFVARLADQVRMQLRAG